MTDLPYVICGDCRAKCLIMLDELTEDTFFWWCPTHGKRNPVSDDEVVRIYRSSRNVQSGNNLKATPFPRNDKARCVNCVKKSFDEEDSGYYRCSALPNWPKINKMWLVVHWCHLGAWRVRLGDSPPWLASITEISAKHEVLTPESGDVNDPD